MISNDAQAVASSVGRAVGMDEARGDLLPDDKVEAIKQLRRSGEVAMVGIAMGAAGSDVALETADVALMIDDLSERPFAVFSNRRPLGAPPGRDGRHRPRPPSLARLDDGGRLVTVLSAGVRRAKPAYRAFFDAVDTAPYRLRADIEVGGTVYRSYGTSVRTRLLVIDRMGPEASGAAQSRVETTVESVAEGVKALAAVRS